MKGLAFIQHWWGNGAASNPTAAYAISCPCGQVCKGQRRAGHQVVRCSGCGRAVFVLPASPLPAVPGPGESSVGMPPADAPRGRPWLLPLVAGGLALLVVALLIGAGVYLVGFAGPKPDTTPTVSLQEIDRQIADGRRAFNDAHFQEAAGQFETALAALQSYPHYFSASDRRQLVQLQRQAAVLADWPREPLDKILARTGMLNDEEWKAAVGRYHGKAAVFDVEVRRDASRQYHVNMTRPLAVARLRLDLQNVRLLEQLPLDAPQRVLFAARLAEIRREDRDAYAVRLEPDSGVLLTDVNAGVVGGVAEPEFQALLERQRAWAAELP